MTDLSEMPLDKLKALRASVASQPKIAAGNEGSSLSEGKPSLMLGFKKGLVQPIDRAAAGLEAGAKALGLNAAVNSMGAALGLPSDTAEETKAARQEWLAGERQKGNVPSPTGEIIGNVMTELPLAMTPLGKSPLALGAASGVLSGDKEDLAGIVSAAGAGAAFGKAGDIVSKAVGKVVSPTVSKAVQALKAAGVRLTPGEIAGGGLGRFEDAIASYPFLGDAPRAAQQRSFKDLNLAAAGRVLAPIGKKLPPGTAAGEDATRLAGDTLSTEYDNLLSGVTVKSDQQGLSDLYSLQQAAKQLPKKEAQEWANTVRREISTRLRPSPGKPSSMTGEEFKAAESAIKKLASRFSNSSDGHQQNLGELFGRTGDMLRGMLERSAGPDVRAKLANIDEGWANLVRVEKAGAKAATNKELPGVFSPSQLAQGVREADQTVRKRGSARGTALMQDLASAGMEVLPARVPDSGTPYRHLATVGLPLLAGGAAEQGWIDPKLALAAALMGGAYSKPGMRMITGAMTGRQDPRLKMLADYLSRTSAPALAGGAAYPALAGPAQ